MQLRSTRRLPTRFPTRVESPQGEIEVVIVDVTELGAKADGLGVLPAGTECGLRILSETVAATVRWSAGGAAGLAFAQKLTPRQLDVVRHRRTPRPDEGRQPRRSHGFTELR